MYAKPQPLLQSEIHLWWGNFDSAEQHALPIYLSAEEQKQVANASSPKRKRELSYGRSQLRYLLGNYLDEDPTALHLIQGPHGRPMLAPPRQLDFNLSHSSGVAVYVFSRSFRVGVDCERPGPNVDIELLAKRVFSENEQKAFMNQITPKSKSDYFFTVWTKKEAMTKLSGEGLQKSFAEINVEYVPGILFWHEVIDGHHVSVAYASTDTTSLSAAQIQHVGCCL